MDARHPPTGIAIGLLVAGLLPVLNRDDNGKFSYTFFQPPAAVVNAAPELAPVATYYPAAAGAAVFVLGWLLPRGLWALGIVAIGAGLPALLIWKAGLGVATYDLLPGIDPPWDWVLLGGIGLSFVATRALALSRPFLPLAFLCALGGAAVLTWLVYPRPPANGDAGLGLVTQQNVENAPFLLDFAIVRGFLRNQDFAEGTHFVWYAWWNVYLVALSVFPLLCVRVLLGKSAERSYWAGNAHGALLVMLIALVLMLPIRAAFGVQLDAAGNPEAGGIVQGLVRAANEVRLVVAPLLLPLLALVGISEILTYFVPSRR